MQERQGLSIHSYSRSKTPSKPQKTFIAIAHTANEMPRTLTSRERERPVEKNNLQTQNSAQMETSCKLNSLLKLRQESPSEKRRVKYSGRILQGAKFRDQYPSRNEEQEDMARDKARKPSRQFIVLITSWLTSSVRYGFTTLPGICS